MRDMIRIEIFDPPMCCSGGMCGPDIDPKLLDIAEAILKLKDQHADEVQVARYVLSQQPAEFMRNKEVMEIIRRRGVSNLPITCINGMIWKRGEYPSLEELESKILETLGGREFAAKSQEV